MNYHSLLLIDYINLQVNCFFYKKLSLFFLYVYIVNTTEVGNGVLSVKIKQNENKISHDQTRISTHLYEISFKPETLDECIAQISFNGEHNRKCFEIKKSRMIGYSKKTRLMTLT